MTSTPLHVLILENCPEDAETILRELRRAGYEPIGRRVETEEEYLAALHPGLDVILADHTLPGFDSLGALEGLRKRGLEIPLIVVSGTIDQEAGVAAMRHGAADCLSKDRLARLGPAVARELERQRLRKDKSQAEQSLRAAQERLKHVLAFSPSVIYSLRLEGETVQTSWVSPNVPEVMGYDAQESCTLGWWQDRLHPQDREETLARWPTLLADGQQVCEYRFRHQDGSYRWIRDARRLVRDGSGRPVECIGSWSDITERRQLEEQFHHAQKMEAVGRLAGGVAHDFNNLLTVISGYSDLLLSGMPKEDPAHELLEEIKNAGRRGAALTRQLLAFSRRQVLAPVVLDLNAVVSGMEKMLRRLIGEDVELAAVLSPALHAVKADPGEIEQVLMNLGVNARDAMPGGGKLTIETVNVKLGQEAMVDRPGVRPGPYVMLAVTDNGCGMDAATREHIFEPFFTTKGPAKGTGLGLATVYGIIQQCGGHISVASEPGQGTTFTVYLPAVEQPAPAARPPSAYPERPRGSETILLVEDQDEVRVLAREVLTLCGYTVREARSGDEALRLSGQHAGPIELLITDVVMPCMSGQELAERVARLRPGIKILYMSGYTGEALTRQGLPEADAHFIEKPFAPLGLARRVRDILDEGKTTAAEAGMNGPAISLAGKIG